MKDSKIQYFGQKCTGVWTKKGEKKQKYTEKITKKRKFRHLEKKKDLFFREPVRGTPVTGFFRATAPRSGVVVHFGMRSIYNQGLTQD